MTRIAMLSVCVVLLGATSAGAQDWEVVPLAGIGMTTGADLERRAPELDELKIGNGFTWGAQVGYFFSPHWGVEAEWTRQATALQVGTAAGEADLFDMNARQVHGNVVYQFGPASARLRPFVFGGLGGTFLSGGDLESETKLSSAIGAGLKYFPRTWFGARFQGRFRTIWLNDESAGDFCDPFGFCQGTLNQFELMAGLVLRF